MWKARLTYGLWLVGAALLYVFTDRYYALVLLLASVAGPMVCVLCNLCRRTGPAVSLHLAPSAAKGEKTEGMLKLDNRTALPIGRIDCTIREENRLTGESVSRTVSLRLPGRTAAKLPFTLESRHGGAVELHVECLAVRDLFGLSRRTYTTDAAARCTVFPDTFSPALSVGTRMSMDAEGTEYSPDKPGFDPAETFDIREYRAGDSPRSIHWKLSAKLERMVVREPGLPLETSYMFLFENDAASPAAVRDTLAEAYCSVVQVLAAEDVRFGMGWTDGRTGLYEQTDVHGSEDLIGAISRLLDAGADEESDVVRRYLDGAENDYAHVICFAPHVPAAIAELSAHAGHVTLFLCSDESWPEALYADNVHVMAFTPENYLRELSYIAI